LGLIHDAFNRGPTVRGSWGILSKSGKVMEKSEKVGEFYIPKSGKNEMVRESQGKSIQCTRVQMLTKMQKKF